MASGVPSVSTAPLTSTVMRVAKLKTRSMSCSMSSTDTSDGSAATVARISWRSPAGTPAAGSSSSSTRGFSATASAISSSLRLPYGNSLVRRSACSCRRNCDSSASASAAMAVSWPMGIHQRRAASCRLATAMARLCSGVSVGNSWLIWKVRTRPRSTRWLALSEEMSWPSSSTRPSLAGSVPVSRFTSVVLPAPFGPISAWRAPRSMFSDTLSVATKPPKRFTSPWVRSTTSLIGATMSRAAAASRGRRASAPPGTARSRRSSTAA